MRRVALPLAVAFVLTGCGSAGRSHSGSSAVADRGSAAGSYAVFRRPPGVGDTPPAFGTQTRQHMARRIARASSAGVQAWGEIEQGQACVYVWGAGSHPRGETPGGGCARVGAPIIASASGDVVRHGPVVGKPLVNMPFPFLAGLVPDGVTGVQLRFADGTTRTLTVYENGFALRVHSRLTGSRLIGRVASVPGASTAPTGGAPRSAIHQPPTSASRETADQVARRAFAVFRRPARSSDKLPSGRGRPRSSLSRLVYTGVDGRLLYVYVADAKICTFEQPPGDVSASGDCADAADAGKTGLGIYERSRSRGPADRASLLVPDGVKVVTVKFADRTTRNFTVRDNAFVYARRRLVEWTYTTTDGIKHDTNTAACVRGCAQQPRR